MFTALVKTHKYVEPMQILGRLVYCSIIWLRKHLILKIKAPVDHGNVFDIALALGA